MYLTIILFIIIIILLLIAILVYIFSGSFCNSCNNTFNNNPLDQLTATLPVVLNPSDLSINGTARSDRHYPITSTPLNTDICSTSQDCPINKNQCINGICVGCLSDNQCPLGNKCINNVCTTIPCSNDSECENDSICSNNICTGKVCNNNSDCNTNQVCVNNICLSNDANISCNKDVDCHNGLLKCNSNVCIQCLTNNDCSSDQSCSNGFCQQTLLNQDTSTNVQLSKPFFMLDNKINSVGYINKELSTKSSPSVPVFVTNRSISKAPDISTEVTPTPFSLTVKKEIKALGNNKDVKVFNTLSPVNTSWQQYPKILKFN